MVFLEKNRVFNILLFLFPVSFLLGNLLINLEIFLFILFGLFFYGFKIFDIKTKSLLLLTSFFILLFFSTTITNLNEYRDDSLIKSILFFRYFICLLIVRYAVKDGSLNLKYLFFSCLICSLFLSVDVIYQYFNGYDFFGYMGEASHNSGIFDEEKIAGSYIQRFSMLGVFSIPLILNTKNPRTHYYIFLFLLISIVGIIFSGNRMPVINILLFFLLPILFLKELRKVFLLIIITSLLVFTFSLKNNVTYKNNIKSFFTNVSNMIPLVLSEFTKRYTLSEKELKAEFETQTGKKYTIKNYKYGSGHAVLYVTGIETWMDNPVIGDGIKSFRYNCAKKMDVTHRRCNTHPHQYYIEMLNDVGLAGILIFFFSFYFLYLEKRKINFGSFKKQKYIYFGILFSLLIELFPFKSTGSFFSTGNAAFIFFLIGLILNLENIEKKKYP